MQFTVLFCTTQLKYSGAMGNMYPTYCVITQLLVISLHFTWCVYKMSVIYYLLRKRHLVVHKKVDEGF